MTRSAGASKDAALADIYPSDDQVDVIGHTIVDFGTNDIISRQRREDAVANAEADGPPLTAEQMKASLADILRGEGMDDYELYRAGLLEREPIDPRDTAAVAAEVCFVATANGRRGGHLAARCAWFERMTRTDPQQPPADIYSARYQRGNQLVHDEMRRRISSEVL